MSTKIERFTKSEMRFPVDMKKAPYRGILPEVAEELGVTRQAVRDAYVAQDNLRIIAIVNERIEQRRREWEAQQRAAYRVALLTKVAGGGNAN